MDICIYPPEYRLLNVFVLLMLIIFHCFLYVLPYCFRFRILSYVVCLWTLLFTLLLLFLMEIVKCFEILWHLHCTGLVLLYVYFMRLHLVMWVSKNLWLLSHSLCCDGVLFTLSMFCYYCAVQVKMHLWQVTSFIAVRWQWTSAACGKMPFLMMQVMTPVQLSFS